MKVVFFCGGLGTRLREYTNTIPKPMVLIGDRPILWHLMKYYAHYGHNEFILCLGYRGDLIRQYFMDEMKLNSNNVEFSESDDVLRLSDWEGSNWAITLVDTGEEANIGQRLNAVKSYIGKDETFFANYSDGLSDLPLEDYLEHFYRENKIASFVSVKPTNSFHAVEIGSDGLVQDIRPASQSGFWINGGFFVFKREIFDYIEKEEELVEQPFKRLIENKQLLSYRHKGFWACMDTPKDKKAFDKMYLGEEKLWRVWLSSN